MDILYILGAGASASIDQSVPVMANFFEKAIEMLDESNNLFCVAFAVAEEARAFPSNPNIENSGIRIGELGRLLERIKRGKLPISQPLLGDLEKRLKDYIHVYKENFKSDKNRMSANLEDVLLRLESYNDINPAAANAYANAYDRFQFVIGSLFGRLDKDLSGKFSKAAHHDLITFIANGGRVKHTFISFNYDLWLEKALAKKELWHPEQGHGSYRFQYYSPPVEDAGPNEGAVVVKDIKDSYKPRKFQNNNKSKVTVLKPHGSLAWRLGRDTNNVVVILENGEHSCVSYNKTWYFPPSLFQEGTERTLIPLVVPPTENKIRNHPIFWQTDQDIVEALIEADVVVIIGWSMPETDHYIRDILVRGLNGRNEQLKKMVICHKGDRSNKLQSKFEAIFRPTESRVYDEGFSKKFVDFLKDEL